MFFSVSTGEPDGQITARFNLSNIMVTRLRQRSESVHVNCVKGRSMFIHVECMALLEIHDLPVGVGAVSSPYNVNLFVRLSQFILRCQPSPYMLWRHSDGTLCL